MNCVPFLIRPARDLVILVAALGASVGLSAFAQDEEPPVVAPKSGPTQIIRAFNGKDLSGWTGSDQYWSVEDGEIVGRSTEPLPASTYLISKRNFSDFRLTFEFRLAQSETPSGVAFWGTVDSEKGSGYAGHLVAFPSKYGFYELEGRNLIHRNERQATGVGKQHDWNTIEILAQGNRIRLAINGEAVSDWRDPQPDGIQEGPIALQLHASEEPQEIRFRKLRLETFPENRLLTLSEPEERNVTGIQVLSRNVKPDTPGLWTPLAEVVLPDELLAPTREVGLKTMGIRAEERDSYFAILQKARETDPDILYRAAVGFRNKRRELPKNAQWKSQPPEEFPAWVDLYQNDTEYHGKLITVHGHIRKLIEVPQDENPYGIEKVYEAWLYDLNAQGHPTVILSTSIDPRLKTGTEVEIDHCFATGYFFKNMGYRAQDASRYAPVLIANRLEYLPSEEAGQLFRLGRNTQLQILLVTVIAVILGRHFWRLRKLTEQENRERETVREIVDQNQVDPSFDSLADSGGTPDFAELAASDSSSTAPPEHRGESADRESPAESASESGVENASRSPETESASAGPESASHPESAPDAASEAESGESPDSEKSRS